MKREFNRIISLKIDEELNDNIEEMAYFYGMKKSEFIRMCINNQIAHFKEVRKKAKTE